MATRYTGAERGTVFLLDRERDEIWSLVGLGLEKQEIRIAGSTVASQDGLRSKAKS